LNSAWDLMFAFLLKSSLGGLVEVFYIASLESPLLTWAQCNFFLDCKIDVFSLGFKRGGFYCVSYDFNLFLGRFI